MKNSLVTTAAALAIAAAASAQTTPPTPPVQATPATPVTTVTASVPLNTPAHLKGLTVETLRPEHSFPALGTYTATGSSVGNLTITLDETNKGIVWVEGLPQGKFKALMKKAPATYKIPAQQTETGKAVAEGTLFLNPDSGELTVVLGKAFNDEDPAAGLTVDAKAKGKSKAWQYTGQKSDAATAPVPPQQ